ncbi:hypothetical protein [Falsiroseomonas sp.]|uniref:hypothetical protein n=1 Tax=Falsiroseomonas sp. TaxID=2870721 RepID=UPI002723BDBC|nr:hypothetical protein [Falsiroseomonas sp.]MDO9499035.1 hypothetical protein [Falsiroseomonas sp.]
MSRLPKWLLLAGAVGLAPCLAPSPAQAQAHPFTQHPFGFAGPAGMAGAPWGWWSIGQPLLAPGLWMDPMGLGVSSGGGTAQSYQLPAAAPHQGTPALGWGWQVPWASSIAPGFAVQFGNSLILNGGMLHAW